MFLHHFLYVLPCNGDILLHNVCGSGHLMMIFKLCLAGFSGFLFCCKSIILVITDVCFIFFSYSLYLFQT